MNTFRESVAEIRRCSICRAPAWSIQGWTIEPPLCWGHYQIEVEKVKEMHRKDKAYQKFLAERRKLEAANG